MDRRRRKQMKQDAFVEHTRTFVERFEENPRPWILGAVAVVAVSLLALGIWQVMEFRGRKAADRLARAQAALTAPVVRDEAPRPDDPYRPTFASDEQRLEAALARLDEAEQGPTRGIALLLEGSAALEAGRLDDALAALTDAADELADDPTLAGPARAALATALAAADRLDEAIEIWTGLVEADQEKAPYPRDLALAGLARALETAGRADEARSRWQEIVDLYPSSPMAAEARRALDRLTASAG
ncbi:MAG: hypothetical protein Kow0062_05430 [Acidobacteriota bacterium]